MSYECSSQEDLIIKYLPLVKNVVGRIESKNRNFDLDDLINIGVIGLMDALKKYDPKRKIPFEAYASFRIRGSVIDELRKAGPVSRDRIEKLNEYYSAKGRLENQLMSTPDEDQICRELGIDQKELFKLHETIHYLSSVSLDSLIFTDEGSDTELIDMIKDEEIVSPEEQFIKQEKKSKLVEAVEKLEERERILLNLYYVEELSMKEIGYILDISIPRVSQIHGKILLKLRGLMVNYVEG